MTLFLYASKSLSSYLTASGCLRVRKVGKELEKIVSVTFSRPDIRLRVHINKDGVLFNPIKDELHRLPGIILCPCSALCSAKATLGGVVVEDSVGREGLTSIYRLLQ